MTTFPRIAVLGAGNMGGALLQGLLQHRHPPEMLWASNRTQIKLASLQSQGIHTTTDNLTAAKSADVIVLAVKPLKMREVVTQIAPAIAASQTKLILSIATGVRSHAISQWLGGYDNIVCAMPNLVSTIGWGATGLYAMPNVSQTMRKTAESVMQAVGEVVWVEKESLLDTITALSGCGPAYCFLMAEAMAEAGVKLGLSASVAHQLSLQTMLGAAKMAMMANKSLAELRERVTSPQGATEQALNVLNSHHFKAIIEQALTAAKTRAETLAKESEDR